MMSYFSSLSQIESFEYPWVLLCLILIPIIAFTSWAYSNRMLNHVIYPGTRNALGNGDELQTKRPFFRRHLLKSWRFHMTLLSLLFYALTFVSLTITIARPYGGSSFETRAEGIDIYLSIDLSASMKAYDYSLEEMQSRRSLSLPTQNRYETAITTLKQFTQARQAMCHPELGTKARCDRIGIVIFAQEAYIDLPLTNDYNLVLETLDRRSLDDINSMQTAIGDGIARAVASLRHSSSISRNIILLTDGDKKGGRVSISQAIKAANQHEIRVFPILIGKNDTALLGHGYGEHMQFREAHFPTNFQLLEDIASQTRGSAYRASSDKQLLDSLGSILNTLETDKVLQPWEKGHIDLSLIFIILAFAFYFISRIILSIGSKLFF